MALVYGKAMELDSNGAKDSAAVTLMSTDIDGIASGIKDLHEIWANIFELGVSVFLLQRQVGAACFVVVVPAVGKASTLWQLLSCQKLT